MIKFFIVADGIIGTAHTNREGKTVDFRPVEIKHDFYGKKIVLTPTDGYTKPVEIKPAVTREDVPVAEDAEYFLFNETHTAEFMGAALNFTVKNLRGEPTPHQLAKEAAEEAEKQRLRAAKKAAEPADMAELEVWITERLANPFSEKSTPNILLRGVAQLYTATETVLKQWLQEFPLPENQFADVWNLRQLLKKMSGSKEELAGEKFLAEAVRVAVEKRKADKKAEWLARQGK